VRRFGLAAVAIAVLSLAACGYSDPYTSTGAMANESPGPSTAASPSPGVDDFNAGAGLPVVTYPDGLQVVDLTVGTGAVAKAGEDASVNYTGWLTDGTLFDSSRTAGRTPLLVKVVSDPTNCTSANSAACVIAGWDEGLQGMKIGGKRKLIIPAALGYGTAGQTDPNTGAVIIPPNATLVFEVELLSLAPSPIPSPSPSPPPSPSPSPSPSPTPS
jgi:FKBP-type peptidyl-prolyl cis-trans isomerase FkpA